MALEKSDLVRSKSQPKYSIPQDDYDVGAVHVATPFVISAVPKPIALVKAGEEAAAQEPVVVSGWGVNQVSAFWKLSQCKSAYTDLQF